MKVAIIGLGHVGLALAKILSHSHQVFGTTRSLAKLEELSQFGHVEILDRGQVPSSEILECEIIVLTIPLSDDLLDWFKAWNWNRNSYVIYCSSISVYEGLSGAIDFDSKPISQSTKVLSQLKLEEWIRSTFTNWNILRLGGLFGGERHPGKYLSGRQNLIGGEELVNLVHHEDVAAVMKLLIESPKHRHRIMNMVYPEHPKKQEYYVSYCRSLGLPVPTYKEEVTESRVIIDSYLHREFSYQFPI